MKLQKNILLLLCAIIVISLFSCGFERPKETIVSTPEDASIMDSIESQSLPVEQSINYENRKEVIEIKSANGAVAYRNSITYPYVYGDTAVAEAINNHYSNLVSELRKANADPDFTNKNEVPYNNGFVVYLDIIAEIVWEGEIYSICESWKMQIDEGESVKTVIGKNFDRRTGNEIYLYELVNSNTNVLQVFQENLVDVGLATDMNDVFNNMEYVICEEGIKMYIWDEDNGSYNQLIVKLEAIKDSMLETAP